jgi:quercetin dioxygenase-like cupin family protein
MAPIVPAADHPGDTRVGNGNDGLPSGQERTEQMETRLVRALLVVVVGVAVSGGTALATPPSGVTSKVFAVGQFDEISAKTHSNNWHVRIKTNGESDLHVLENTIVQGGSFGWHSHPGPSLVIVKTGALTLYRGDDPECRPEVIEAGSGFVDNGGDVHLVRNEGSVVTVVYVTSLVPRGAARRIDEPRPGNCPF